MLGKKTDAYGGYDDVEIALGLSFPEEGIRGGQGGRSTSPTLPIVDKEIWKRATAKESSHVYYNDVLTHVPLPAWLRRWSMRFGMRNLGPRSDPHPKMPSLLSA